ncbi:hypothetical protein [Brevibacterium album]|uniref:hypothetical protein n=1 Tax=Brevibacterium album TaxID=417948 RepID=UPI000401FA23|nr:hypothetical protein [Brevibacterium album]
MSGELGAFEVRAGRRMSGTWMFRVPAVLVPQPEEPLTDSEGAICELDAPCGSWAGPRADDDHCVPAWGFVRRAVQIESAARHLVGSATGIPEEEISIRLQFDLPDRMADALQAATVLESEGRELLAESARLRRECAGEMCRDGLTHAEIGLMMGISAQRVQQLTPSKRALAEEQARERARLERVRVDAARRNWAASRRRSRDGGAEFRPGTSGSAALG